MFERLKAGALALLLAFAIPAMGQNVIRTPGFHFFDDFSPGLNAEGAAVVCAKSATFAFGDMTDGGGTSGTYSMDVNLPAGALVLGWQANTTTGFTGDTTAVISVGVAGDADAFSADTAESVLAAGRVGSHSLAAAAGNSVGTDALDVLVTITGTADWGNVAAGSTTVTVYYLDVLGGGSPGWSFYETNLNARASVTANSSAGWLSMALDADVNAEESTLYWADSRTVDVGQDAYAEFEVKVDTLPTLTAELVIGMAGDRNASPDAVANHAWFKLDGSGALLIESDDGTTDNDDVSAGVTIVAGTTHKFRVDFTVLSSVNFYVDGLAVSPSGGLDMSALTSGTEQMQPYVQLIKGADAGVGAVSIGYVQVGARR